MTRFFPGVVSRAEIGGLLVDRKCGKLFAFLPTIPKGKTYMRLCSSILSLAAMLLLYNQQ